MDPGPEVAAKVCTERREQHIGAGDYPWDAQRTPMAERAVRVQEIQQMHGDAGEQIRGGAVEQLHPFSGRQVAEVHQRCAHGEGAEGDQQSVAVDARRRAGDLPAGPQPDAAAEVCEGGQLGRGERAPALEARNGGAAARTQLERAVAGQRRDQHLAQRGRGR